MWTHSTYWRGDFADGMIPQLKQYGNMDLLDNIRCGGVGLTFDAKSRQEKAPPPFPVAFVCVCVCVGGGQRRRIPPSTARACLALGPAA